MALPLEFALPNVATDLNATYIWQRNNRQIELLLDKFIRNYLQIKNFQTNQITVAADTSEHDMHSTAIAAGEMRKNGAVQVLAGGNSTGAGNKTISLYLGGVVVAAMAVSGGNVPWFLDAIICNRASETSQIIVSRLLGNGLSAGVTVNTATVDTSATGAATSTASAIAIKTTGKKATGADTLTEEFLSVVLVPSPT